MKNQMVPGTFLVFRPQKGTWYLLIWGLFFLATTSGISLAGFDDNYSQSTDFFKHMDSEKDLGCKAAKKEAWGMKLTSEEQQALNLLKSHHAEEYKSCVDSAGVSKSESQPRKVSQSSKGEFPYEGYVVQVMDVNILMLSNGKRLVLLGVNPIADKKAESLTYLKGLVLNQNVTLQYDSERYDKYHRLQAYVFRDDKDRTFVNQSLVLEGYATPYFESPNTLYKYQVTEALERRQKLGKKLEPEGSIDDDPSEYQRQATKTFFTMWGMMIAGGCVMIFFAWMRRKYIG